MTKSKIRKTALWLAFFGYFSIYAMGAYMKVGRGVINWSAVSTFKFFFNMMVVGILVQLSIHGIEWLIRRYERGLDSVSEAEADRIIKDVRKKKERR